MGVGPQGTKILQKVTFIAYYNVYSVYFNYYFYGNQSLYLKHVSVNLPPFQAIETAETSDLLINLMFQGRSSDQFESVQPVVSAANSKIEERYSSGLILFILAHSIKENNRHVDRAPSSEAENKKFFLDKTYGLIDRSLKIIHQLRPCCYCIFKCLPELKRFRDCMSGFNHPVIELIHNRLNDFPAFGKKLDKFYGLTADGCSLYHCSRHSGSQVFSIRQRVCIFVVQFIVRKYASPHG